MDVAQPAKATVSAIATPAAVRQPEPGLRRMGCRIDRFMGEFRLLPRGRRTAGLRESSVAGRVPGRTD